MRHQREVTTRRTKTELEIAKKRCHILEGLMVAVNNLDRVIKLIRASKSPKEAREGLMATFSLTEVQAQAILDLRLQKLTGLELLSIENEYRDTKKRIAELEAILASDRKLANLIKRELSEVRALFDGKRHTAIIAGDVSIEAAPEEALPAEEMTVTLLDGQKLRKTPSRLFNAAQIKAERPIESVTLPGDGTLRLFTDRGELLALKVSEIPETHATAKPVSLVSLLEMEKGERIIRMIDEAQSGDYLLVTENGMIKRTAAEEFRIRSKRTTAIGLKEKDLLLCVREATEDSILLVSRFGMSIRFAADTVPSTGRTGQGVVAIKLEPKDKVFFMEQTGDEGELITVSDRGYGKRSFLFDYELQGRNGKGVKTFDFKKNGSNGTQLAFVGTVTEPYTLILEQRHGAKTSLSSEQIHIQPKAGKGELLVPVVLDDDVVAGYRE